MPQAEEPSKSKALYEFKKQLEELRKHRGRGTELVSVYITPGYQISDIAGKLREEAGQASNIKSATTKKNVQGALDKILQFLKGFREPPVTGMAVFAGNVSEVEGRPDIQLFSIVPPVPLNVQFYRCESQFVLEPLDALVTTTDAYGLVVLDGKEATVAVLQGKQLKVIKNIHSTAHAKTHKGGQCLREDSLVQMADGQIKQIREVKPGDEVLAFNWKSQKFEPSICETVFARTSDEAILIETSSGKIIATNEHRLFCLVAGNVREKFAEDLQVGDLLVVMANLDSAMNANACQLQSVSQVGAAAIISIRRIIGSGVFYDLEVPGNENFLAQGFVVHNSSNRFMHLREEGIEFFYQRISEAMAALLQYKNLKGVIIGGPGPVKEDFVKDTSFNYQLKVLGTVDTGYTDEFGLREIIEKSGDIIAQQEAVVEKKLLDDFMREVVKGGLATYGETQVRKSLLSGQAKILLLSEGLEFFEHDLACGQCGKKKTLRSDKETIDEECDCGGRMKPVATRQLADELLEIAEKASIPIEMVSRDSPEGHQFFGTFGGIGAFLRYK